MKEKLLSFLFLIFFAHSGYAQIIIAPPPTNTKPATKLASTQNGATAGLNKLTIKLKTNADCTIFIDDDNKGIIHAGETKKIYLGKGEYELLAKSTGGGYKDFDTTLKIKDPDLNNSIIYHITLPILLSQFHPPPTPITSAQSNPVMVNVEGGTFSMGSNDDVDHAAMPVHSVTLSSFSMAKHPTTVAEYRVFCSATNHPMPIAPSWGWDDKSPIVNVSYDDAVTYCNWLSGLTNKGYRLPTEAEYEYAARGGNRSNGYTYSGSNDLDEVGWYEDNSGNQIHPVGRKKPNELGLYDMSGNVWEWCRDWFDEDYYSQSPSSNPKGPSSGTYRVLRGGSWGSTTTNCRVADRGYNTPDGRLNSGGFRVVSPE